MMAEKRSTIIRKAEQQDVAFSFHHPLGGDTSEITMTMLARTAGLKRVGVNLARVPVGKEAFVYHRHHSEEEWVYILEGKALSDIEGKTDEVGAGDFIAYPEGVAHNLKNVGDCELVYLMGGEQTSVEVADFPKHKMRLMRAGERIEFVKEEVAEPFTPELTPVKNS